MAESAVRGAGPGPGGRRRPPPRPVEVVSVRALTPRLVSVVVGGPALEGFGVEVPTAHIKLFLPAAGQVAPVLPTFGPDGPVWPGDGQRPVVRTYTPRRFDPVTSTLEIQFVLHGTGPASEWAARARTGDRLALAGPGGRFALDPAVRHWWIGGDESALPAVGTLLEALPASATAEVHLEVAGPDDEIPLTSRAALTVAWHHRRDPGGWGVELADALSTATPSDPDRAPAVWVACEAGAVRRIRRQLLAAPGRAATSMVTRGYWRLGESNHPDHDYGDD